MYWQRHPREDNGKNEMTRDKLFCVLVFYIPTIPKVIIGLVPTGDSAHLWQLYSDAALADQATGKHDPISHTVTLS